MAGNSEEDIFKNNYNYNMTGTTTILSRALRLATESRRLTPTLGKSRFSTGLGTGVHIEGGSGRYRHITPQVKRTNLYLGFGLVAFVGSVYAYTYSRMATNELSALANELDEVRASRENGNNNSGNGGKAIVT